jgi:hemolysin activation/secretion protein
MRPSRSRSVRAGQLFAALLVLLLPGLANAAVLPSITARADDEDTDRPPGVPSDADLVAASARIGAVRIVIRDLFDTSRPDENTALFRLANRLHIDTRESTIRDQLLFDPGQAYDPRLVEESARILRTQRYLRDAWIRPVAWRDGIVDLEVVVQDVWTFNPGVSFGRKGGRNTSGFEIEELNLLGTGAQLSVSRKSGVDRDSNLVIYRDRQLGRSWWSVDAQFADNSDGQFAQVTLDHPFYSLDTRWAGGVAATDDERIESRYDLGEVVDQYRVDQKLSSAYVGWSRGLSDGWVTRWKFGYTRDERDFSALTTPTTTRALPGDRKLAYPWIAAEWVEDDFRTERNRDQIARTEDIALGLSARLQIGFARESFGADRSATMLSGGVSHGWRLTPRQTLQLEANMSGRLEDGKVAGGLLGFDARWYFRQSPRRVLYLGLSTLNGKNLDLDQQIQLGGDNGLRGYPLRYQSGTSRWLFTAEQRLFSNWYPFRLFNVGGAAFFDMGEVRGNDPLGTPSRGLLRDIGVGLRLGNGRSALGNVVHIDVAFPLDGDPSIKNLQFLVETKRSF